MGEASRSTPEPVGIYCVRVLIRSIWFRLAVAAAFVVVGVVKLLVH